MHPPVVIEKPEKFRALIEELKGASQIAVDTESNSFYAYFERICLIQISTADQDYVVDPLVLRNLEPLGEILSNEGIEKIFHAASNDVMGLRRDFHFQVRNLFDTAVACNLLGYKQLGLAKIIEEHFDIQLNKKLQRCNWGRRPLQKEQINYARLDTHYLIPLRRFLADNLREKDLWHAAQEAFQKASEQEIQERPFQPENFMQIRGARSLDSDGRRILKALYRYRDKEARRQDRAPFRVLSNETLLRLAIHPPKDLVELSQVKGLPRMYYNSRAADHLLKLIHNTHDLSAENHS